MTLEAVREAPDEIFDVRIVLDLVATQHFLLPKS